LLVLQPKKFKLHEELFLFVSLLLSLALSSFSQEVTKDDAAKVQAEIDKLKAIAADTV
jgi:hypothetical protein